MELQSLNGKTIFDIDFKIEEENIRKNVAGTESYLALVRYTHSWNPGSEFELEVSFREEPILPLQEQLLVDEMYFKYCEVPRFPVRHLQKEELLAEKLRAALQRIRSRDLYDLYLFSGRPFDKDLVRKLVVLKCWNVREPFTAEELLDKIENAKYDWDDLQQLVRKGDLPPQKVVTRTVTGEYAFLKEMDSALLRIVRDSKAHREDKLRAELLSTLSSN